MGKITVKSYKSRIDEKTKNEFEDFVSEYLRDAVIDAMIACMAPRHTPASPKRYGAEFADAAKGGRDEDEVKIRRRWFGKRRGYVRHTFLRIRDFLDKGTLVIVIGGSHCNANAWAYTRDHQNLKKKCEINICDRFFDGTGVQQIATLIHELTHLVRGTIDYVREADEEDLMQSPLMADQSVVEQEQKTKDRDYLDYGKNHGEKINPSDAIRNAYSYQYFVEELLSEWNIPSVKKVYA